MKFGKTINEIRKRLNISQAKLAAQLKVSVPTINRWENNKSIPDNLAMAQLAQFVSNQGELLADLYAEYFAKAENRQPTRRGKGSLAPESDGPMEVKTMEGLLWKAACSIRGEKDAPKFKDYLLPLIFLKRLSDVFEDEMQGLAQKYKTRDMAEKLVGNDHSLVRFYMPIESRWGVLRGETPYTWPRGVKALGEKVTLATKAVAKANPALAGVIDAVDFNAVIHGVRDLADESLEKLIEIFSQPRARMGLKDVEPDFLGRAYEYLLRKFAEGQGQSAGEFYTPKEVGLLMARLLEPKPGQEIYDPCCGSGGLLIKCELRLMEREPQSRKPARLYGQEYTATSYAIARMNMIIHDMTGEVARGDSMMAPKFAEGPGLKRFDLVVTNPMWNQKNYGPETYDKDPHGRFSSRGGYAPASSADWAWVQHVASCLKPAGRAAIVLDTGAASRGSGNQSDGGEKSIRRWFLEQDLVEGVILLPDNLFYNTTAAGLILLLNMRKPEAMRKKIVLVNAGEHFEKGRPKNFLNTDAVTGIAEAYAKAVAVEKFVKVLSLEQLAKEDYNLSPSRYISTGTAVVHRPIPEILKDLARLKAEEKQRDKALKGVFEKMGYTWPEA